MNKKWFIFLGALIFSNSSLANSACFERKYDEDPHLLEPKHFQVIVPPKYPTQAAKDMKSGCVAYRFKISNNKAVSLKVLEATTKRVFDREAARSLKKIVFPEILSNSDDYYIIIFNFTLHNPFITKELSKRGKYILTSVFDKAERESYTSSASGKNELKSETDELKKVSSKLKSQFDEAIKVHNQGGYQQAYQLYKAIYPVTNYERAKRYLALGIVSYELKEDAKKTISLLKMAISLDSLETSSQKKAIKSLGFAYIASKNWGEALKQFEILEKLGENSDPEVLKWLAYCNYMLKEYAFSDFYVKHYLSLDLEPNLNIYQIGLNSLLALKNQKEHVKLLAIAEANFPDAKFQKFNNR